jgi:hypothetical protein
MTVLSMDFKKTYTEQIRERYLSSNKSIKAKILDEYCNICGYTRKHAIRALVTKASTDSHIKRPGPKPKYPPEIFAEILGRIWLMADKPCSKYLITIIQDCIAPYQSTYGKLESEVINKLQSMSSATMDRLLNNSRFKEFRKALSGTTHGGMLKEQIPLHDNHWDDKKSGYFEADTVAMCGDSLLGQFIWCLDMTDVATGWTEVRACWGKTAEAILRRIQEIEHSVPMPLLGVDSDNGSEFLNYKILEYLQKRKKPVQFTRSRPYKKNDNAHVEQKNFTHVRKLLGYYRYDLAELTPMVNDLLIEWCKFKNFFIPCQKTIRKIRVGSKIKRIVDKPKTPYKRLLDSDVISAKQKLLLIEEFRSLNPFTMKENIDKNLAAILKIMSDAEQSEKLH